MAKAPNQNGSDSEERKPGEQSGLDTRNSPKKFLYKQVDLLSNYIYLSSRIRMRINLLITRVVLAVNAAS